MKAETWHPWWWQLLHPKRAADYRFQYRHARSHQLAEAIIANSDPLRKSWLPGFGRKA